MRSNTALPFLLIFFLALPTMAGAGQETEAQREVRMKWWTDARFGMFIHWGLYALPARHEWVKQHEAITEEAYQKYFDHFNPDLYNPKEWARLAKTEAAVLSTPPEQAMIARPAMLVRIASICSSMNAFASKLIRPASESPRGPTSSALPDAP